MPHDPAIRPKRPRDPFKAAHEIFQEAIGEKPRHEAHPPKPEKNAARLDPDKTRVKP